MSRSLILDSTYLQTAIGSHFLTQWHALFHYFPIPVKSVVERFNPEVRLAIDTALVCYPLLRHGADLGQQMMRVNMNALQPTDDTRTQRLIVFYLMTALPPYLEKRKEFIFQYLKNHLDLSGLGEEVMYNQDWRSKWGPLIMCAWKAAKIGNFVAFLQEGKYPTIAHRILSLAPFAEPGLRDISEEILTRELLWSSFVELLAFIVPLINVHKLRAFLRKMMGSKGGPTKRNLTSESTNCAICNSAAIMPSVTSSCEHIFCHYCASANAKANPDFECPECGVHLSQIKPMKLGSVTE